MTDRPDTPGRRSVLGVALGAVAVLVLLAVDVTRHPAHVPVGLFVVGPLLTATLAGALPTALVATTSVVAALAVGLADELDSTELVWRWTAVVLGGLLAVVLADQRRRRDLVAQKNQDALVLDATQRLVERLEAAQRVGRMGSWELHLATGRVEWSDSMAELVGAEPGSVTTRQHVTRYVAPGEQDRLDALFRAGMESGGSFEYSQRMVHREGHEILTVVVGEAIRDPDGRVVGVRGITRDVTAERLAAQRLDQMRDQLVATDRVVDVLQRSLLPQLLPVDPRVEIAAVYRPVDEVAEIGGDWYDAFPLTEDELGLSIGDVAGHGLGAATLMAHARLALRWEGFTGSPPGAALARVDRMLERETDGRTFATAIFGRYRLDTGELRWSRAGHCPPIVLTATGAVSVEACGGPPLAAGLGPPAYEEGVLTLQPGDTVLLYTDGLVERRRRPFQVGLTRLHEVLEERRNAALPDLVAAVPDLLSDAGPLEDDCCVVALRRLG